MADGLAAGLGRTAASHQYTLVTGWGLGGEAADVVARDDVFDALKQNGVKHMALLVDEYSKDREKYVSLVNQADEHGIKVHFVGPELNVPGRPALSNSPADNIKANLPANEKVFIVGGPETGQRVSDFDEKLGEGSTARVELFDSKPTMLDGFTRWFQFEGAKDPDPAFARYYRDSGNFEYQEHVEKVAMGPGLGAVDTSQLSASLGGETGVSTAPSRRPDPGMRPV